MHHKRCSPVPFGKTQTHTPSATNICTEVSRYLDNVDLVALPPLFSHLHLSLVILMIRRTFQVF